MHAGSVLVVGGTGGLGAGVCAALAGQWPHIVVGYHHREHAAQSIAASLPRASAQQVDLTDEAALRALLDKLAGAEHPLRAVVVASGVAIEQPFVADASPAEWRDVIETELVGFITLIRALIPILRGAGGGSIVAVTSFANAHFPPGDALSSVPKAGIESICRAVAKEEGSRGIRVNCVAPGMFDSGLGARYMREKFDAATWDRIRRRVPLGRYGLAADIGEAAAFLLSSKAGFITGQTLVVDGGQSL